MRVYTQEGSHLFCGHWNGSPVEIGEGSLQEVPSGEVRHSHPYCEYYVVLDGEGELEVEGSIVAMTAGTVIMVEPGEAHRVVSIGDDGCRWVIVKERSEPDSKSIEA